MSLNRLFSYQPPEGGSNFRGKAIENQPDDDAESATNVEDERKIER